jgi:lipoyl(octanoyl) transferase
MKGSTGYLPENRREPTNRIFVVYLGIVNYSTGLELQKQLAELCRSGKIGNVLLLLEHPAVITLGRSADRTNILASPKLLEGRHIAVIECDRGGDVTYHGPGQLVGYPIVNLRSFVSGAGEPTAIRPVEYVHRIEEVLIRSCGEFGIPASRIPKFTGVWTRRPESRKTSKASLSADEDRLSEKIAAIGIHVSRGITSHGFALNVNTDLEDFKLIVPCGISTKAVTSMRREMGHSIPLSLVAASVGFNFGAVFDAKIIWLEMQEELEEFAVHRLLQLSNGEDYL